MVPVSRIRSPAFSEAVTLSSKGTVIFLKLSVKLGFDRRIDIIVKVYVKFMVLFDWK
jgi:hypothetical protein